MTKPMNSQAYKDWLLLAAAGVMITITSWGLVEGINNGRDIQGLNIKMDTFVISNYYRTADIKRQIFDLQQRPELKKEGCAIDNHKQFLSQNRTPTIR